jgi:hypothetical protein
MKKTTAQFSARSERSIRSRAVGHGDEGGGFASRFQVLVANKNHRAKYELLKEWFRADPDAAMEAIKKVTDPSLLIVFLFEDDPIVMEAMGRHLDDIIVGSWYNSGFGLENHEGVDFDFAEGQSLVEKVASLPETDAKKHLWNHVMAGWFYKDWKEAAGWVDSMTGSERSAAERALKQKAAGIDMGDDVWGRLGWVLGSKKPEKARSILANLDGQSHEKFRKNAMLTAFEKQPEKTKKWAAEMEGEKRQEIIYLVFQAWYSSDQNKAEAWRDGLRR